MTDQLIPDSPDEDAVPLWGSQAAAPIESSMAVAEPVDLPLYRLQMLGSQIAERLVSGFFLPQSSEAGLVVHLRKKRGGRKKHRVIEVDSPSPTICRIKATPVARLPCLKFVEMTQTSLGRIASWSDIRSRNRQRRRVVVLERVGAKS